MTNRGGGVALDFPDWLLADWLLRSTVSRIRFLAGYGISDTKRLRKMALSPEGVGVRQQHFVFESPLDDSRPAEAKPGFQFQQNHPTLTGEGHSQHFIQVVAPLIPVC